MHRFQVKNVTRDTLLADDGATADTFMRRFKGLMGVATFPFGSALLIVPCTSIHTFFMKVPIDALFLDQRHEVLAAYHALAPWRMSRLHPRAHAVLELPAGTARASRTDIGDRLEFGSR